MRPNRFSLRRQPKARHPKVMNHVQFYFSLSFAIAFLSISSLHAASNAVPVQKLNDILIYQDDKFYCSFPSIVRRPNGELLVAFRRAPERRALGEPGTGHTDPNSYL